MKTIDVQVSPSVLLHVQAGSATWDPSDEDLRTLETQFKTAISGHDANNPDPIVVATRSDIHVVVVPLAEDSCGCADHDCDDEEEREFYRSIAEDRRVQQASRLVQHWQKLHAEIHDVDRDVYASFAASLPIALTTQAILRLCTPEEVSTIVTAIAAWQQSYIAWSAPDSNVQVATYINETKPLLELIDNLGLAHTGEGPAAAGDEMQDESVSPAGAALTALALPVTAEIDHGATCAGHAAAVAQHEHGAPKYTVDDVLGTERLRVAADWLLADFENAAGPGMAAVVKIEASWYSTDGSRVNNSTSVTVHTEKSKNVHARVDTMHVPV